MRRSRTLPKRETMSAQDKNKIQLILSALSTKPGVYRYLDENGKVIYVGKAKNLKRRVSSYFNKNHDSSKVRMLVTKIRDIQTTVVDTEWEALLLENTLIKEYKPKYNIMLRTTRPIRGLPSPRRPSRGFSSPARLIGADRKYSALTPRSST